jgi:hypothetical protein
METKTLAVVDKVDGHKRLRLRSWQKKFITALKQTPNVTLACQVANVSREAAYKSRRNDQLFAEQWQAAINAAVDNLETKAFELALRDNVPLLMFLLKAHRSTYRETQRHEHLVAGRIILLPEKEEREP